MPVIPYVKQTWTDGVSSASAARLTVIEQGIHEVSLAPSVRVYHNATQLITNNTETAVAFNSELWDTAAGVADTMHDTATNNSRLTCRYAGKYLVEGSIEFAANATGQRYGAIRKNAGAGTYQILDRRLPHSSVAVQLIPHALVDLAVNDFVELIAFQDSGAGLNIAASSATSLYACSFMMVRVG